MSKAKDTKQSEHRPYWQVTPCPTWCTGHHQEWDHGSDRTHYSSWDRTVTLTTHAAHLHREVGQSVEVHPSTAVTYLAQGVLAADPAVVLEAVLGHEFEPPDLPRLELTSSEARELIKGLKHAVRLAEGEQ